MDGEEYLAYQMLQRNKRMRERERQQQEQQQSRPSFNENLGWLLSNEGRHLDAKTQRDSRPLRINNPKSRSHPSQSKKHRSKRR